MCVLCDQFLAQRYQVLEGRGAQRLESLSIASAELIDNSFVEFTRQITASDSLLNYYLHDPGGAVVVAAGDGGFDKQTIQSVAIPDDDQAYFREMVARLDSIIDLDFREINSAETADVALYYDTEIDLGNGGSTLGLATTSGDTWELFVNYPQVSGDDAYLRYVNLHELGHALGLEHPFDGDDGDSVSGITDPWQSTYPEDTVMSYRNPASGQWPDFFTDNDLNALIEVWGAETQRLGDGGKIFIGKNYREVVEGGVGDDRFEGFGGDDVLVGFRGFDVLNGGEGDDSLRAGNGRDFLSGGFGSDVIYGGFGRNTFYSERDGAIDQIFFKSDQWAENWLYSSAGNNQFGEKADILQGLDAFDRIYLQGVSSDLITINSVVHDYGDGQIVEGLGIFAAGYLEAVYTGGDLSANELQSLTSGIIL